MDPKERLKKIMDGVKDLPTIPVVATKINAMLQSNTAGAAEIGDVILNDQALTVKLLNLVNSAYYSLPREIASVQEAVSFLGARIISQIVLSLGVLSTFKGASRSGFDRDRFWTHCIAVAVLSQDLAKERKLLPHPEEAFTAGLLHDLGKIAMDHAVPDLYKMIVDDAIANKRPFNQAEDEFLSVTHGQVGEWVARNWELPQTIVVAIRHHHHAPHQRSGMQMSDSPIVDCVALANYLAHTNGFGFRSDGVHSPLPDGVLERVGLDASGADAFAKGRADAVREAVKVLSS